LGAMPTVLRGHAFVRWLAESEVDPNDWTEYPGVSVNRKTPSQETGKRERPPPLAGLLGGEEAGRKK